MKKQTILLSALALTMLASCEKEVVNAPKETNKAQISLMLGQYGATKGLGATTAIAAPVVVGTTFKVESFEGTTTLGAPKEIEFVQEGATNIYIAKAELDAKASKLQLTGNADGTTVDGVVLSANVNTRQGDVTKPVVLVWGEDNVTGTPGAKVAAVTVKPEMARIEITGANTGGALTNIKSVMIKAIYLNNVKLERGADVLSKSTGDTEFAADYKSDGIKAKLFDKHNSTGWEVVGVDGTRKDDAFTDGQAIGYNIFPQAGGEDTKLHPHISIEISYTEGDTPKAGFINIKGFENATGLIPNFKAGTVYAFSVKDIIGLLSAVTPEPEPEQGSVTITCTVQNWTVETITPVV